ncbi:hypothetical protein, partial [Campylobacter peloridis]|uniref:hypothetical protein n=1 Tax=Campylobacter peloridis TaxID=488546 RepID=UPI001C72F115
NQPSDSDVILASDDLHQDIIDEIIADITNNEYFININDKDYFISILNVYNQIKNNPKAKAKFLSLILKHPDESTTDKIIQSLDFLSNYYKYSGLFDKNSENRFDENALVDLESIKTKVLKQIDNTKLDVFMQDLQDKVNYAYTSKKDYDDFINNTYTHKINGLINEYNKIAKELEEKQMNTNEQLEKLTMLKDLKEQINQYYNLALDKLNLATAHSIDFNTFKENTNKNNYNFTLMGDFKINSLANPNSQLIIANVKPPVDIPDKPITPPIIPDK